ncbi:MAG: type I-C CRISPR-associated protein Cas8c/Csd1, partial [Anaerolineaceae bacterium]|nr:type I-C CRISPR-associated protein Cas8c/Csd1 [Anaerolineaceae bacterium]
LSDKDETNPEYAKRRFDAFCKWNKELLVQTQCIEAQAVIAFLDTFDPQTAREHPVIADHLDELLKGRNLIFKLDGQEGYVHEHPEIRRVWEAYKTSAGNQVHGQCLITGEPAPVARLHASLQGVYGANSSGASLVGFNARAYESYNKAKGQGLNSPVSEKAAFAYTTVLNHLLSPDNENLKIRLGDTTVVYWAESSDKIYETIFSGLFEPDWFIPETSEEEIPGVDKKAVQRIKQIAEKIRSAQQMDTKMLLDGLDENTRFYVLGLSPNAARVSVRFFHMDPFVKIIQKIMAHYQDMQIDKEFDDQQNWISVRRILEETVSKKSSDKSASPLMSGAVFRAILTNSPYPAALYNAIINRIRADMDDEKKYIRKINYVRSAVIKAFLIRKYRNYPQHPFKEVLIMSLNEQSTIPAYLLGRLFAVLEKVQKEAVPDAKATIKDRYFTSACASPKSVFPTLLRLSQHHISKAEYGYASDNRIQDILNLLDVEKNPIPARLNLDEQGIFVLGYYHQRAAFYLPKNKDEDVETE